MYWSLSLSQVLLVSFPQKHAVLVYFVREIYWNKKNVAEWIESWVPIKNKKKTNQRYNNTQEWRTWISTLQHDITMFSNYVWLFYFILFLEVFFRSLFPAALLFFFRCSVKMYLCVWFFLFIHFLQCDSPWITWSQRKMTYFQFFDNLMTITKRKSAFITIVRIAFIDLLNSIEHYSSSDSNWIQFWGLFNWIESKTKHTTLK